MSSPYSNFPNCSKMSFYTLKKIAENMLRLFKGFLNMWILGFFRAKFQTLVNTNIDIYAVGTKEITNLFLSIVNLNYLS